MKKDKRKTIRNRRTNIKAALCAVCAIALFAASLSACGGQPASAPAGTAEATKAATTAAQTTAAETSAVQTTAAETSAAAETTTVKTTAAAATAGAASTGDTWSRVQQNGKFILGLDDEFPPMGFRDDNNEIVGFDIDMARAAAEYLGVEVELKPVIWDTVLLSLNGGEIDCIWNGMSVTDARKKEITFSKSYVNSDQIIVTPAGSAIKTKADMAGKTIGTQMGSSTLDALDTDPATRDSFGELREYETFTKAMMDLDNGRLDAVVIDGIAFYGDFNVKAPGSYNVLAENFGSEEMAVGLRQNDDEWIGHINMAFDYLHASGKAAEISKKWFGEDILIIGGPRTVADAGASDAAAADGSWEKIKLNGKFVLGLDDEFPPMGFRDDNNEIVGFDIEMAKAAAEYLGVEVELKPVIWDTVLLSLNGGEIDCVWNGMSVTDARKKEITFSKSYVNSDQIIVTPAGSGIKTKADMAGKTVGTQMGSSTLDALDTDPATRDSFGELREYETFTKAMMDLDNGRLDAVVIDGIAFYGDFNVKAPDAYSVLSENFGSEEMAVGLRQTDSEWINKVNEALNYLKSSGKAAEISVKWFGADILII